MGQRITFAFAWLILSAAALAGSWTEWRYLLNSKVITAHYDGALVYTSPGRAAQQTLQIMYRFEDMGLIRRETDDIAPGWNGNADPGDSVFIQYIPNSPYSRLAVHTEKWRIALFLVTFLGLALVTILAPTAKPAKAKR